MSSECLTSISSQQLYEMSLILGENIDEFVEISNTSASEEIHKFVVAVTWLYNVDDVFSLWPGDTSNISKLSDKCMVRVDEIQQLNTIDRQSIRASSKGRTSLNSGPITTDQVTHIINQTRKRVCIQVSFA